MLEHPRGRLVAGTDKILAVDGQDHVADQEAGFVGHGAVLQVGDEDSGASFRMLALDDHNPQPSLALLQHNLIKYR